jgi:WS/DGAT/MGAT family acyltransferase
MDKLGAFDQFFYKADQYDVTSMIMCGVTILEPARPGDKLDSGVLADHLAARLQKIPLLRMKFVQDPLRIGTVRKVEDPDFDIWDHIVTTTLPRPGCYAELSRCLGELSAEPLTPEELWRWIVVDGLEGGRLAVVTRIHHALADGVGVVEVLSTMFDEEPVEPERPSRNLASGAEEPSSYALLGDALAESTNRLLVKTPQFFLRKTAPLLGALGQGAVELLANRVKPGARPEPPDVQLTSLNPTELSSARAVSYKTLSLPEVKTLSRQFSCKVNDIGLLLFSFALQHYFDSIGEKVDFDLWCGMPISTRSESSAAGGNQVTNARVNLHNTVADVRERLQAISRDSAEAKSAARPEKPLVEFQEVVDLVFPPVFDGLLYLMGRFNLMEKANEGYLYANALLSNVPGPPHTVYIANAVVVENIPMIPIIDLFAVSGGFVSVGDLITIGFHCQADAVKDPDLFVRGVELGMEALREAAAAEAGNRKRKPAGKKKPGQRKATPQTAAAKKPAIKKASARKTARPKRPSAGKTPAGRARV